MGEYNGPYVTLDHRVILQQALDTWGEHLQTMLAIEECAELTTELAREHRRSGSEDAVIEEIADALIMLHQLALLYDEERIAAEVDRKMERLEDRLEAENA